VDVFLLAAFFLFFKVIVVIIVTVSIEHAEHSFRLASDFVHVLEHFELADSKQLGLLGIPVLVHDKDVHDGSDVFVLRDVYFQLDMFDGVHCPFHNPLKTEHLLLMISELVDIVINVQ